MKLISHNPYRVAGILSNVTEKELQRQKSKIKRYSEVGKQITSDYDFSFLENIDRSEQSIESAFSSIEQNQDKVRNSLFWFLNVNTFDNTALDYLKNGDLKKAREIWEKVTIGKAVTNKNYSSFNNISTLNLLSTRVEDIKEGVEGKIQLLEANSFKDFAHTIADETFTADSDKQIEYFIDDILNQFKTSNSQLDINILFSGVNGTAKKYLSKQFTEEPIHNIESEIESTKTKRKANKSNAYEFGSRLFVNCKDDLTKLKKILGANDLKYKLLADSLSTEVMQCGIDYFKEWQEQKDPSKESLKLLKLAETIACGKQTLDRAKENIEAIQEWVNTSEERELNQNIGTQVEYIIKKLNLAVETLNNKGKYPRGYNDPYSDLPISEQPHNKIKKQEKIDPHKLLFETDPFGSLGNPFEVKRNEFEINLFRLARDTAKNCKPKLDEIKAFTGVDNKIYQKLTNDVAQISLACLIEYVNGKGNSPFGGVSVGMHEVNIIRSIGELDMNPETLKRYKVNKNTLYNNFKQTASSSEKAEIFSEQVGEASAKASKLAGQAARMTARAGKATAKAAGTFAQEMRDKKKSDGGGCYIATMAYGDYDHPQVIELRKFRDNYLSKFFLGRHFIKFYYKNSPTWVKKLENKGRINSTVRLFLDSLIKVIN